jgi:A/G-specific adenine glycosylase
MLQQTQVARVIEFYPRFLQRYPTLEDLASAPADEVRESWEGLGYYSRARNLHAAVRRMVTESGGRVPRSPVELARLPGIGAYTAGAVASLAFGAAVPAVDTNVARVLGRVFDLRGAAQGSRRMRRVWVVAAALVPPRRAADWNQALMDLGALVCTARAPRCPTCPVRSVCATRPRVERRGRAVAARAFPRSGALRSRRT